MNCQTFLKKSDKMFNPTEKRIYIKPIRSDSILAVDEKNYMGEVLKVGKGVLSCKKGDTIVFEPYGASDFDIEGEKFTVVLDDPKILLGKYGKGK